ncbi:hypothetical protein MRX96_052112 [Rhipicephalus microplus]
MSTTRHSAPCKAVESPSSKERIHCSTSLTAVVHHCRYVSCTSNYPARGCTCFRKPRPVLTLSSALRSRLSAEAPTRSRRLEAAETRAWLPLLLHAKPTARAGSSGGSPIVGSGLSERVPFYHARFYLSANGPQIYGQAGMTASRQLPPFNGRSNELRLETSARGDG